MKKITLLLLLLVSTTLIFAQENHKKCISTKLVEEELKNNTDYVDARKNAVKINYNSKEKENENENKNSESRCSDGPYRPSRR
jgi:hypothetical protein